MAIGSGIGGQFGLATETTYGTYVAPARFHEVDSVEIEASRNYTATGGIAAGRLAPLATRDVLTTQSAAGSVELEVVNKGMGLLLQALMGPTVTPVAQTPATAYLQTHPLGDNFGKNLSMQAGIPTTAGVVVPHSYLGCKITGAEFSCEVDGTLKASFDVDSRQMVTSQTLGAAAYAAALSPFHWGQAELRVGATVGAAVKVDGTSSTSVQIQRSVKDDRFYQGNGGLKSEPITNDLVEVSGSIGADYIDKTIFEDRFMADSVFAISWVFTGPVIGAGPATELFAIDMPACKLTGGAQTLSGLDVVSGDVPFKVMSNGTDPVVSIRYVSTDNVV